MDYIRLILQISILAACIYYFAITKKRLVKTSIGLYIIYFSITVINILFGQKIINDTIFMLSYFLPVLVFSTHLYLAKITFNDKLLLGLILFAFFIKIVMTVLHLPMAELTSILFVPAIGLIIYLNAKRLNEIREELRFADIVGIFMILYLIF